MHSRYDDLARDATIVLGRHVGSGRDRRRAEANLHFRTAWARARRWEPIGAFRAFLTLIEKRPVTLVELPARVAVGRLRRRWNRVSGDEDRLPTEWRAASNRGRAA
jgi:hypothetical protein